MNKLIKQLILITILAIVTGCTTTNYTMLIMTSPECNNEKEFYFTYDKKDYYKVCIGTIELEYPNFKESLSFEDSIKEGKISLKEFISRSNNKIIESNYTIYNYDSFNLIKCDNDSILFINVDAEYNNTYCN